MIHALTSPRDRPGIELRQHVRVSNEKPAPHPAHRFASVHAAGESLLGAFARMSVEEMKAASDEYVRAVLLYSGGRVEVVRIHFLMMLFQLIAAVHKRHLLRADIGGWLVGDLNKRLEEAATVYRLLESFREASGRLSLVASSPLRGPKCVRLTAVLQYLQDSFTKPLKLSAVARRAGFSVSTFARAFKQATGTSFVSYLRMLRVEHAKYLLRTTRLPTEQVAQASGFRSAHHFIRSFKTVTGQTPSAYRRQKSGAAAS